MPLCCSASSRVFDAECVCVVSLSHLFHGFLSESNSCYGDGRHSRMRGISYSGQREQHMQVHTDCSVHSSRISNRAQTLNQSMLASAQLVFLPSCLVDRWPLYLTVLKKAMWTHS